MNEEPEYDPEVIANAHLTMEDDHYKCSVCKMKFKQPGNARRHIITVHRYIPLIFLSETLIYEDFLMHGTQTIQRNLTSFISLQKGAATKANNK